MHALKIEWIYGEWTDQYEICEDDETLFTHDQGLVLRFLFCSLIFRGTKGTSTQDSNQFKNNHNNRRQNLLTSRFHKEFKIVLFVAIFGRLNFFGFAFSLAWFGAFFASSHEIVNAIKICIHMNEMGKQNNNQIIKARIQIIYWRKTTEFPLTVQTKVGLFWILLTPCDENTTCNS